MTIAVLRLAIAALAFPPPKPAPARVSNAERSRRWRLANLDQSRRANLDRRRRRMERDPDAYHAQQRGYWAANREAINVRRRERRRKTGVLL